MCERTRRAWVFVLWLFATSGAAGAMENGALPITVTEADIRSIESIATVRGDLESPSTPTVGAEIPGRIVLVTAEEGDAVQAGQVLAELDSEGHRIALEQATASIQRIEAQIRNQRLTLKRYQDLVAQRSTSQSELDKAKTDLDVLLADLAVANSRLSEVRYRLSKTRILSPVTGVVHERMVAKGDYVQEGDPLFQVAATDRLQARLYFPEVLARRIRVGLPVRLEIGCEDSEGVACVVETKISRLRPMLDATNRALTALAELAAEGGSRPGSSLMAHVVLDSVENAVLVPERSLVRRPAGTVVYRLQGDRVVQVPVQTGLRDGDWIQIRSGLAGGERVALDGAGFLTDGAVVSVRDAQ